jgi:CheY-like chemotaxis protein
VSNEPIGLETAGSVIPRRVLVVDDNVDAADTLRMWIELEGHEVRVAHDGPGALEALRSFEAEIALLDIGMPLMDGYELAQRVRARYGRRIVLIALTGWGQVDDRRRSLDAGFDEHLTKPIDGRRLRALLAAPAGTSSPSSLRA